MFWSFSYEAIVVGTVMLKQITVGEVVGKGAFAEFDYNAEAELFPCRNKKSSRRAIAYRRFGHAADAIRFAVEELAPESLVGAYLEVGDERYDVGGIRRLYESLDYPLVRRVAT